MRTLHIIFLWVPFVATAGTSKQSTDTKSKSERQTEVLIDNGLSGVATIAGIASRNGRVSSLSGIKFYSGPDSATKNFVSNRNNYFPLKVSAEKDGRYASGTVQVFPGYVSSSASAGYAPQRPHHQNTFKRFEFPQVQPRAPFFPPPRELYTSQNLESLLSNDFFKFPSPSSDMFGNNWVIPGFDPFVNFWR